MVKYVVYVATNTETSEQYVGMSSLPLKQRVLVHLSEARRHIYDHAFHAALRLSPSSFTWVAYETFHNLDDAVSCETHLIKALQPEYNSGRPGAGRFGPSSTSRRVVCLTDKGRVYESASAAARAYSVPNNSVVQVCLRQRYRHRAGGHIFRYIDDNEGLGSALRRIERAHTARSTNAQNLPRPVMCLNDGCVYETAKDAANAYKITANAIKEVCRGRYTMTGNNLRFQYAGAPKAPPIVKAHGELPMCALTNPNEEWRRMEGLEDTYAISDHGRICSLERIAPHAVSGGIKRRGVMLKFFKDKDGYNIVTLRVNGKSKRYRAHALVASAFVGEKSCSSLLVLHKNGIRDDNRPSNLYYGTQKDNIRDARVHGTLQCGEKQHLAKLTEAKVRWIRQMGGHLSQRQMGKILGVRQTTIQKAATRLSWAHVN